MLIDGNAINGGFQDIFHQALWLDAIPVIIQERILKGHAGEAAGAGQLIEGRLFLLIRYGAVFQQHNHQASGSVTESASSLHGHLLKFADDS